MPNEITGGGEQQPPPPSEPTSTTKEATYSLTVPTDTDIADVPRDMAELATDVKTQLDLRLTEAAAARSYQGKIIFATSRPAVGSVAEGAIVFVYV